MTSVILVGAHLTDPGTGFAYRGESSAYEGCPYRHQCLNLIESVRYRILDMCENTQVLDYTVHDKGVRTVEVEPAPVTANVLSKGTYTGSKANLQDPCPHTKCPNHEYCVPEGAKFDQKYRIHDVLGDPPHDHCYLDRGLALVEFEPADE